MLDSVRFVRFAGLDLSDLPISNDTLPFSRDFRDLKTRPYTRQYQSRAGGQGQYSSWAGAVTQMLSPFSSKRKKKQSDFGQSDFGPTDGPTDRHSNL